MVILGERGVILVVKEMRKGEEWGGMEKYMQE